MELEDIIGYKYHNDGRCFFPNDVQLLNLKEIEKNIKYTFACTFLRWDEEDDNVLNDIKIDYYRKNGYGEVTHPDYSDIVKFDVW